jgi:hypoxanthine phosphoribosyltransferase
MSKAFPILLSQKDIQSRNQDLADEISSHYLPLLKESESLVILGVLSGSFIFTADLVRCLKLPCEIDFIQLKSYEGTESTGEVKILKDTKLSLKGRHCLVVEDIVDTGLTAKSILELLKDRGASSVKLCSLLHKPSRAQVKVPIDFLGFSIEDHFVVGYGLDFNGQMRQWKDIVIYQGETES